MKYDFTKVKKRIDDGLTYNELAAILTRDGGEGKIDESTIRKAVGRGTASKRVAKAVSAALQIPMRTLRSVA